MLESCHVNLSFSTHTQHDFTRLSFNLSTRDKLKLAFEKMNAFDVLGKKYCWVASVDTFKTCIHVCTYTLLIQRRRCKDSPSASSSISHETLTVCTELLSLLNILETVAVQRISLAPGQTTYSIPVQQRIPGPPSLWLPGGGVMPRDSSWQNEKRKRFQQRSVDIGGSLDNRGPLIAWDFRRSFDTYLLCYLVILLSGVWYRYRRRLYTPEWTYLPDDDDDDDDDIGRFYCLNDGDMNMTLYNDGDMISTLYNATCWIFSKTFTI
jgi:hypothetical protein